MVYTIDYKDIYKCLLQLDSKDLGNSRVLVLWNSESNNKERCKLGHDGLHALNDFHSKIVLINTKVTEPYSKWAQKSVFEIYDYELGIRSLQRIFMLDEYEHIVYLENFGVSKLVIENGNNKVDYSQNYQVETFTENVVVPDMMLLVKFLQKEISLNMEVGSIKINFKNMNIVEILFKAMISYVEVSCIDNDDYDNMLEWKLKNAKLDFGLLMAIQSLIVGDRSNMKPASVREAVLQFYAKHVILKLIKGGDHDVDLSTWLYATTFTKIFKPAKVSGFNCYSVKGFGIDKDKLYPFEISKLKDVQNCSFKSLRYPVILASLSYGNKSSSCYVVCKEVRLSKEFKEYYLKSFSDVKNATSGEIASYVSTVLGDNYHLLPYYDVVDPVFHFVKKDHFIKIQDGSNVVQRISLVQCYTLSFLLELISQRFKGVECDNVESILERVNFGNLFSFSDHHKVRIWICICWYLLNTVNIPISILTEIEDCGIIEYCGSVTFSKLKLWRLISSELFYRKLMIMDSFFVSFNFVLHKKFVPCCCDVKINLKTCDVIYSGVAPKENLLDSIFLNTIEFIKVCLFVGGKDILNDTKLFHNVDLCDNIFISKYMIDVFKRSKQLHKSAFVFDDYETSIKQLILKEFSGNGNKEMKDVKNILQIRLMEFFVDEDEYKNYGDKILFSKSLISEEKTEEPILNNVVDKISDELLESLSSVEILVDSTGDSLRYYDKQNDVSRNISREKHWYKEIKKLDEKKRDFIEEGYDLEKIKRFISFGREDGRFVDEKKFNNIDDGVKFTIGEGEEKRKVVYFGRRNYFGEDKNITYEKGLYKTWDDKFIENNEEVVVLNDKFK